MAGCAGLPHPFAPEERTPEEKAALLPPHGQGIWVGDVEGLPEKRAARVTDTLLATLHAEGIPASASNRNAASFLLNGEATLVETEDATVRLLLRWTMAGGDGRTVGTVEETETFSKAALENDPGALDALTVSAGRRIIRLVRGEAPPPSLPAVAVWPVDGAPGDGRDSLTFAVRSALSDIGIPLARPGHAPDLILLGEVALGEAGADGKQEARLNWSLIRPSGETAGTFTQVNRIAKGRMDGVWGILASSIAAGTAEGVAALIRQIPGEKPAEIQ